MLTESRKAEILSHAVDHFEKTATHSKLARRGLGTMSASALGGVGSIVGDAISGFGRALRGKTLSRVPGATGTLKEVSEKQLKQQLVGSGTALRGTTRASRGNAPKGQKSYVTDPQERNRLKRELSALRAKKWLARGAVGVGGAYALGAVPQSYRRADQELYRRYGIM